MLQLFIDLVDIEVSQLIALVLALHGSRDGQLPDFPHHYVGELYNTASASLHNAAYNNRASTSALWSSDPGPHTHIIRACSSILPMKDAGTSLSIAEGGIRSVGNSDLLLHSHRTCSLATGSAVVCCPGRV